MALIPIFVYIHKQPKSMHYLLLEDYPMVIFSLIYCWLLAERSQELLRDTPC